MQNDLVVESWGVITAFLEPHGLLDRLGPPATAGDLAAAAEVAGPLPAELARWWSLTSGASLTLLPPGHVPYAVPAALSVRKSHVDVPVPGESAPAGTPRRVGWLPQWLPIASDGLFVDLRAGAARGCVGRATSSLAFGGPRWISVGAMLLAVADAIRDDHPVDGWKITADDSGVAWIR
ncbi:hypothetical protein HH310_16510 [Actinoplanes sp. TBRC 11911]|uniref:hypothetical protein n=1 Tax=Actinoplanes sp. TBRC 11911 TaxID=2729386 RepID=UPI00145D3F54|nr:hypothetical protein [Actinoplanes sp. TBRC 11911]NMO52789.1 hypothetical protein [Actinoplanes sp. TBRC 11911]